MSGRTKSEMAFINAAGKLFALRGVDGATVKEIAREAGIDASMIAYHFGGKAGLVAAVAEHAIAPWRRDPLKNYCAANANLLDTHDGQVVFVTGMVEHMFNMFRPGHEESWARSFVLQLLQRPNPLRQELVDKYIKPSLGSFSEVYRRISGNDDFDSAFCWYLMLIAPMFIYTGSPGMIDCFHPDGNVANGFDRRLRHFVTQQLLIGFHLI